ncbi:adhesin, partial [Bacillus thuringiensis]|nr:adhesin [Bacillus thuringiensis]
MKQKKYLSAVMATVIAFTTFMQPVVAGAETITGDKAKSEVKVEQEKAVQEPTVSPDVQTSEMDKKEVTNDKTPKSTTEEQERNKGQPVDEKKTVVEPKVSTTNANPTGVALTDEQKKEQAQLASTDEVKLSQNYVETDDNGDPLRLIEAGKDYTYEVNLDVSGNVTLLSDYVVKVEVEKKYLRDWGEPLHISKPELASEVTYADEGDKKVAYIKFPQLAGGTTLSFPVQLIVEAGLTPDMYEMKPMASLMDSKLNLVKKANEISYKVTYKKPGSQKYVNGQKENGSMVWAGIDDGKGVIKEGTEVPVEFSFSTDLEFLDNYRYFKAIEVVDTLPQGAKFDPKANPDWKLSADGKSVSTTVSLNEEIGMSTNGTLANKLSKLKLSLTFPNGKVNGTYTNNVTKTYIPEKAESYEPKVESKASIDFVLDAKPVGFVFTKKRSEDATIKDSLHYKGLDYTYRIEFKNPNSMPLHNVVIDDYKRKDGTYALDKRMEFTKVQTLNGEGEKVIAYIEEDGKVTEKQITKDGKYYNFPKGTKGYRYEVAKLDGAKFFQFLAYVKISNPKDVKYDTKDASKNLFENEASFKGEIQNPTDGKVIYKAEGTDKDDIPLVEFKESISLRKEITNSRDKVLKGGELHNRLFIHGADSNLDAETVIKGGKIIDLLPKGMTVVKSSVSRQGEVIPNYKNSGQTAIVWTFEDMKAGDFAPYTSTEYPQVGFTAIANDLSEEGTNINPAYLVFDDMENMGIEYKKDAQDKFDFTENSKTDDKVVYSEVSYVYVPN